MKKLLLIISVLLLSACSPKEEDFKSTVPPLEQRVVVQDLIEVEPPTEVNWKVPFYPQAPDGDWGMPWQEACEEASIIQAYYFTIGQDLSKAQFKREILLLVDWEIENLGYFEDTTIEETLNVMLQNYPIETSKLQILNNPSLEDMKAELAQGRIIIAPFAGRMLKNPFYSGAGPYYHMMVIKGYDEENFIVNDVGTKRGADFIYSYKTIMDAMHDWNGKKEDIKGGAKKVIVVSP